MEAEEPALEPAESEIPEELGSAESPEPKAKRRRGFVNPSLAKYALKVLCNDELTKALIGPRGARKDDIQNSSGTRLIFSNRGDHFPHTHYRVLVIYADALESIAMVIKEILASIVECGEKEREMPPPHDMIGKDENEYIFRICLSPGIAAALIGPGGKNIQHIRSEIGIKVFIENEVILGHQMARIVGDPERLQAGLEKINEIYQKDASSEEQWVWSQIVNFNELTGGTAAAEDYSLSQPWQPSLGPPADVTVPVDSYSGYRGRGTPAPAAESGGHSDAGGINDEGVSQLVEIIQSMPPDRTGSSSAVSRYAVNFPVQEAHEHGLNAFKEDVESETGVEVEVQSGQITLTGPLMAVYLAHMMMLKKAADIDREEWEGGTEAEETEQQLSVQEMQQKIEDLKKQVDQVQAAASRSSGKSSGADGKSKSKGKGKGKKKK